ncbi:MAG TPA: glutathione S-transferase, partial [Sphingomonas sanguinis]|nr:glutathione S-transferase [Sphingomonas sanguinis]
MTADLTLYTNPQSRGRIARWMLEETGAAYDA